MKDSFKQAATVQGSPKWEDSVRRQSALYDRGNDIRSEFERDYTRILHCQAYSRLKHKTQVFFAPKNDHICTRMEHVQHVASVATTISKYLGLNAELTKAIALGHDIGHAPFGHFGEECLNSLLKQKEGANAPKKFWHERNSLFFADYIETLSDPDGFLKNLDLTYAVRDGLISHCGEIHQQGIIPRDDAIDLYTIKRPGLLQPFTWEGCVVKISDKISFLGRDLEDARAYHLLDMGSYRMLRDIVGSSLGFEGKGAKAFRSGKAVNTTVLINDMIVDLCEQSSPERGITFSDEYFKFIVELHKFSYSKIYTHWRLKEFQNYARNVIETIYNTLARTQIYAQRGRLNNALKYFPKLLETFEDWLVRYTNYQAVRQPDRKRLLRCLTPQVFDITNDESWQKCLIEYISGMTDQFAIGLYEEIISF